MPLESIAGAAGTWLWDKYGKEIAQTEQRLKTACGCRQERNARREGNLVSRQGGVIVSQC